MVLCKQAQQLESLVMEAEQEDFNKSVENLTKHCNAYVSSRVFSRGGFDTGVTGLNDSVVLNSSSFYCNNVS